MAQEFILKLLTQELTSALADMERVKEKAAMWAIRDCARQVARSARKVAPTYRGKPRKVKVNGRNDAYTDLELVPGEYKKSIKSSKRLQKVYGGYSLKVGPRGGHVHLYAQKVEARNQPMNTGYSAVKPLVEGIHEAAMGRALRKYAK